MEMRKCSKCGELKPISDFQKDKSKSSGYKSQCKHCIASNPKRQEYFKQYRDNNPDYFKEKHAEFRERNREKLRIASHEKYQKSREGKADKRITVEIVDGKKKCSMCGELKSIDLFYKDKRSRSGLKSQCKDCCKNYPYNSVWNSNRVVNRELKHILDKRYRDNNREKVNAAQSVARARRRNAKYIGDKDISIMALFDRDNGVCKICGKVCDWNDKTIISDKIIVGNTYPSIDHIIPLSKGGSHSWDNVQLAHKICNSVKGDK